MAKNGHKENFGHGPLKVEHTEISNDGQPPKKAVSAEQKKALFAGWAKAREATVVALAAVEAARDAEGQYVRQIMECSDTNMFNYKGVQLTAICRNNKDGSKTYFFKRPGLGEVEEIG